MANKTTKDSGVTIDTHNKMDIESLEKLIKTNAKTLIDHPELAMEIPALLVHSSPGLGKSSLVKQITEELGIGFRDVRLCELESVDIKGLPSVNSEDGTMKFNTPDFWPTEKDEPAGILFLDELTNAPRDVQNSCYELILDRKIGTEYKLPNSWSIVACGNLTTDRSGVVTMSSALSNRFLHVELQADTEAWCKWAQVNNINPSIIGFIRWRPEMLFRMEGENLERGWPSPRSWARVSRMIDIYGSGDESLLRKIVFGLIGNRAGIEFMEFYKINSNFNDVLKMMLNPDTIEIPEKLDRKWAMCSSVSYLLWRGKDDVDQKKRLDGFFEICMKLTSDFASMLMMSAMYGIDKSKGAQYCSILYKHPKYKAFSEKHGKALRKRMSVNI